MPRRRLLWQLYPSYLLITALSLLIAGWFSSRAERDFYLARLAEDLKIRARLVESQIEPLLRTDERAIDPLCKRLGHETATRITVILPGGKVIADSDEDISKMDNHGDRPEVKEALAGRPGISTRYSHTVQEDMMYAAVPLEVGGRVKVVVRTAMPNAAVEGALRGIYARIAAGGAMIALFGALISFIVSRRISLPIEEMKRAAERIAEGDFGSKVSMAGTEEMDGLADALNAMARQLDERISTVVRQRNEQEAVLSSMVEGFLAVDSDERVIGINGAAARLLGIDAEEVNGRTIQEAVRNADLQRFIKRALASREPVEGDITLFADGPRFLQAHGTVLRDAQKRGIGALVVMNDVTRLRKLENMRREFVANVSHELKTPVTSIKGFVETLQEGAINNPEETKRFLGIIATQADRLNAIIEDLLTLSRIEQDAERNDIVLEEGSLKDVLQAAVEDCRISAEGKTIELGLDCSGEIRARMNAPLLEQAVVNLIDNAIKYSEPGSTVKIEGARTGGETTIRVRDTGCGIDSGHIPRLFERFYRVDKARSRKAGGTGLGLAITKHIVGAHDGRIGVESAVGQGSVFSIHLPGA